MNSSSYTIRNAATGELAFKICQQEAVNEFDHTVRFNCYVLLWIKNGKGSYKCDLSEYSFESQTMLFFSPHQPFMMKSEDAVEVSAIYWHSDFFCIEKHKKEVSCNGILFNNVYASPGISFPQKDSVAFEKLFLSMMEEAGHTELAQQESLISYLKIFLINASRIKLRQNPKFAITEPRREPFTLLRLKEMIERFYTQKHGPGQYAEMLHVTTKALGKLCKNHFNKTLTELIQDRIIIEAKRELYLTDKSVKEIAHVLGFKDEHYFSRLFKKNTDISPQLYRDTIVSARESQPA